MENFVITKFDSLFTAHDPKGRKKEFVNRRCACFIITTKGKIRFTYEDGELISQAGAPVFLPKGLSYTNECLETAESYVFNFLTMESSHAPVQLSPVSDSAVTEYYEMIRTHADYSSLPNQLLIFEALYSLSHQLLSSCTKSDAIHPIVTNAIDFISQNYMSTEITVKQIAYHCCVSEVYLRKLFEKELHVSPFRKITEMRMNKAKILIDEKRPLKEIAESIGYSDVFQFSRAYKRYFGHSPSKSEKPNKA